MNGFVVRDDPATGKQEIVLDVLVQFDGRSRSTASPSIVSVADAAGREKAVRHLWVDTRGLGKGPGKQVTLTLTDLPYQAGDGFFVEVRAPIPAAERGDYRSSPPPAERPVRPEAADRRIGGMTPDTALPSPAPPPRPVRWSPVSRPMSRGSSAASRRRSGWPWWRCSPAATC